jgi:RNAse (barnase) inhibitor barstar
MSIAVSEPKECNPESDFRKGRGKALPKGRAGTRVIVRQCRTCPLWRTEPCLKTWRLLCAGKRSAQIHPVTNFLTEDLLKQAIIKFSLLAVAAALSACTPATSGNHHLSITGGNLALVAKPADTTTELAQLTRYRGQTSFLDREPRWRGMPGRAGQPAPAPSAPTGGGAKREQQESDVFKVGAAGSKLLYLMNQYRGLQVVSFAKGEEQPELLGRAATLGNSVDQMYSDLTRNRLISLEHDYKYADGQDQSHSMLVVYDVADPKKPTLQRSVDVSGLIADSRIVGDVLYVASRQGETGLVTSYSLTSPDLHLIEQHTLSLPVAYGENMNIIESEENGATNYYLVAVLSNSSWGWWQNSSVIDVVDISDAKGKIHPMMSVATKGFVRERSQTTIRNRTLVVTSNYDPKETQPALGQPSVGHPSQPNPPIGARQVLRIAVETFRFPEANSEIISDDEAQFRKLNIQRQLQGHFGTDLDQLQDQLMNDPKLGLKGRFIRTGEALRKLFDDTIITVGDGSGLSAQLQDVRVQDGLLYAFWVPRDQIDPFDLFDMTQPEKGIQYLGRLHFDGWIERAIPMTFQGRKFVLGLGWINPVVDNENGRRQPQAMIFEVKQVGKTLKAVEVAQLSLEGSNIWTNFNGQDKMVEVRNTTADQGEILFGADRFDKGDYSGGGQIIRFDLNKAAQGQGEGLSQGPFLSGGAEWIRRVFTNTEINRINSFSDHALATFSAPQATGDMHPVNILELARNIAGYETLKSAEGPVGVQIVTDGYWGSQGATTDLRSVKSDNVDVEVAQSSSRLTVPGTYVGRMIDPVSGDLLLVTSKYTSAQAQDGKWTYTSVVRLTRVGVKSFTLTEVAHEEWTLSDSNQTTVPGADPVLGLERPLMRLADGSTLVQVGQTVRKVDLTNGVHTEVLALDKSCALADRSSFQLNQFNGVPYMSSEQRINSRDFADELFTRGYFSPVTINAKSIACQATYNVPGSVQTVNANGDLMVDNTWVTDMRVIKKDAKQGYDYVQADTQHSLLSLTIVNGLATLKDEAVLADASSYGPIPYRMSMPCPGCGYGRSPSDFKVLGSDLVSVTANSGQGRLDLYRVGADAMIEKESRTFSVDLDGAPSTLGLIASPMVAGQTPKEMFAVLKSDRQVQIVRWTTQDLRPQVQKIAVVNERNELQPAADIVTVAGSWWSSDDVHYSPELGSFELALGWNGLTQIRLAK